MLTGRKHGLLRDVSQMELLARGPEVQSGKLEAARTVPAKSRTEEVDFAMVMVMSRENVGSERAGTLRNPHKIKLGLRRALDIYVFCYQVVCIHERPLPDSRKPPGAPIVSRRFRFSHPAS